MAKFLKSIFNPTEKRRAPHYEGEAGDEKTENALPMDERRKLSISRSGRMKQANKKRHSLSLELYGDENMQSTDKPKTMEYYVNNAVSAPADFADRRKSADVNSAPDFNSEKSVSIRDSPENKQRRLSAGASSPDEDIDSYFEVIDKS
ncbi:hypothetical protein K1T71_013582 [Dendrolimus kikuchii]|uniref:Uncharacterized protein n=1 Tax=Dendrolimus kikuchii TaxID=765133 RepID=A0ACC1CGU8_9NEOP|nr:hypothetical protein K1T71_013582 [Dendrolimus kikuchii]